jgi:hypothetical protein
MSNNVVDFAKFTKKTDNLEPSNTHEHITWFTESVVDEMLEFLQQEYGIDLADFPEATSSVVLVYEAVYGLTCLINNETYPTQAIAHDLYDDFVNEAREEENAEPEK